MKRKLQMIMVMIAAIFTFPLSSFAYDIEVDGIGYKMISLSDLTCEVEKKVSRLENVQIPSTIAYNNKIISVVSIGVEAFKNNEDIKSIEIPNSVTSIGYKAFYGCSSLTSIEIPNSVTEIGSSAFEYCSSLTSIEIPNSVTSIGNGAFYNCISLTSIEIPNSVTSIGGSAFYNCSSLTSIEIPNSVTSIGYEAFYNCSSLTSIEIPNSVTSIGGHAFSSCSSLTSIEIPNSVTEISSLTFSNCSSLTSIEIPNSVTSIGEGAFWGCSSLTSIEIPNSVTSIGKTAFGGCSALTSIVLSQNLKFIDYGTFENCSSLISLSIPGSVNDICFYHLRDNKYHDNTFDNCDELKKLYFEYAESTLEASWHGYRKDDGTKYRSLFWDSEDVLKGLLNRITTLHLDRNFGTNLFFNSLEYLTIGSHLSKVDVYLSNSSELSQITSLAQTPPEISSCTTKQYMDVVVKVPYEALEDYKNAEGWKNFWNIEGFDPAGADDVTTNILNLSSSCQEISRYNLNGQQVSEDYKGVVIVHFSDGTTKKIMQ